MFKAGPLGRDGMGGSAPLTWAEVHAFAECTGAISETWERQALFEMSRAYSEGLTGGEDPFAEPPYEKQ